MSNEIVVSLDSMTELATAAGYESIILEEDCGGNPVSEGYQDSKGVIVGGSDPWSSKSWLRVGEQTYTTK